jgi:hypothetical protein
MSQSWRDKEVSDSQFPAGRAKAGYWFQRETGVVGLKIPQSPHPSAKYATPHGAASESIGNIEDWLAVNLPAVEAVAKQLGLPCPPPEVLDPLMRQYLEWVGGERPSEALLANTN